MKEEFEEPLFSLVHRGGGMVNVYDRDTEKLVAVAQSEKGIVTNITLKRRVLNKGALFEECSRYVKEVVGAVPIVTGRKHGGLNMATTKTAKKTKATKVAKEAPAKAEKVSKKLGPAIQPVDLTAKKDLPKTLDLLQKATGGEGYCMCGCGAPVKSRFLPGHDSKLKKILKEFSTDNAKAIAGELGWDKIIKWTK